MGGRRVGIDNRGEGRGGEGGGGRRFGVSAAVAEVESDRAAVTGVCDTFTMMLVERGVRCDLRRGGW